MDWLAVGLMLIGTVVALAGQLGVLIALFRDSKVLFILSLLIPPVGLLLFLVLRFPIAWKPVLLAAIGIGLVLGGHALLSEELKAEWELVVR